MCFRIIIILEGDFVVSSFIGLISTVFCEQKNTRQNMEQIRFSFFPQKTQPILHTEISKKVDVQKLFQKPYNAKEVMYTFCFSEKKIILEGDFGVNGFFENLHKHTHTDRQTHSKSFYTQ